MTTNYNPNTDIGLRDRNLIQSEEERTAFASRVDDRWFAYFKSEDVGPRTGGHIRASVSRIVTFMGDTLATVTWVGAAFKSPGFGRPSTRRNFRADGIDGREWYGTYYESAGDYVRMRVAKTPQR